MVITIGFLLNFMITDLTLVVLCSWDACGMVYCVFGDVLLKCMSFVLQAMKDPPKNWKWFQMVR